MNLTPRKHRLLKFFFLSFVGTLYGYGLYYCLQPSLNAIFGTLVLPEIQVVENELGERTNLSEIKRKIHRHFLEYDTYIGTSDINATKSDADVNRELFTKSCGQGTIFVWLPLRVRLPLIGDQVYEWCWKPKARIQKS